MKKSMFVFCLTAAVGVALPSYGDTYTSASYVQDGLVAQWDAIDNTGIGVHDPSSTIWKDLTGNGRDLTLMSGGCWTNGTALKVSGAAAKGTGAAPAYRTIEIVYKMTTAGGRILFASGIDSKHFVLFDGNGTKGYFDGTKRNTPYVAWTFDATAIRSMAATYTADAVVDAVYRDGTAASGGTNANSWNAGDGVIMIGDRNASGSGYPWYGEVYAIRLYSGALTAEQIATNRTVDAARFTGVPRRLFTNLRVTKS